MHVNFQIAQGHKHVKDVQLYQLFDSVDVDVTLSERVQVHVAHVVKHFAENAITFCLIFHVVQNTSQDHIHSLDIADFCVFNHIAAQDVFEHVPEQLGLKCGRL